ncbi:DUF4097 family beta strand repeat-containing protein [Paenibacillus camelliae]|uniref:DUF4097 family beta strand repeat-containing protein n=1 Tax=Paenibacillus camelliae TaxID=512410 RepID=UPI00203E5061|nr:DUF4097 family beta strand repeat-containing protein [Paenibacillus camelliae]MCM3634729.1 DUF4097 domain-containing protein [Paenibacillus camelliae]
MKRKLWILAFLLVGVGIIGLAFNKFQIGDEGLIRVEKSWSIQGNELNELIVDGASSDVKIEFIESASETANISISGKVEPVVAERIKNTVVAHEALKLDLETNGNMRFVQFGFTDTEINIQVSMPKSDELNHLQVSMSSGNAKVIGAAVDYITLESKSGNATISDIQAIEAAISSQSGNLKIENITSKLMASTDSGNINIKTLTGELDADSKSGNITINQEESSDATVTTSSGDVKFIAANNFDGFYDVRSNSGTVSAPENNGNSDEIIKIKTSSGNITVKQ